MNLWIYEWKMVQFGERLTFTQQFGHGTFLNRYLGKKKKKINQKTNKDKPTPKAKQKIPNKQTKKPHHQINKQNKTKKNLISLILITNVMWVFFLYILGNLMSEKVKSEYALL